MKKIQEFIKFIISIDGLGNKEEVTKRVVETFNLTKDRCVFYSDFFAIRFCYTSGNSFSNTVLSLSTLQKYDHIPFLVCVVTPYDNKIYISNTTFLHKISHSSQELSFHNIKGSFNGSDIIKKYVGIENSRQNIQNLFSFHQDFSFDDNLPRLVEATNNIAPTGDKFFIDENSRKLIIGAINRAILFNSSDYYTTLLNELDDKVNRYSNEIMIASHIENVNIRGRLIEYLITENDNELKRKLIDETKKEYYNIPKFKTKNLLGDYKRTFDKIVT